MDYVIQKNIEDNAKPPEQSDPKILSVQHILGAIFLLLLGDICATVLFFIELLFGYCQKQNRNFAE